MSIQETKEGVILKINHHSTKDSSGWGLENYFTHKPKKLLPLIEGYEVHEGALVLKIGEADNSNKYTLMGENAQVNNDNSSENVN